MSAQTRSVRRLSGVLLLMLFLAGCDSAYRYFLFSPPQPEFTLEPDIDMMRQYNDSSYSVSKDGQSVIFDRKTFKVQVKYMSDYQLNTVEFPDDSKDGEFSANPFTYANWVDPRLGYTPNRFSVFKVSIFNYTGGKLNYDPENSFLVTDRGDLYSGYGREEKTSRNQSLEGYFNRRKGASGVEDEIHERRMGIVRNSVLYLGRPIYAGDNREGLIVFDPLDESVQLTKLVFENFITGYDENNEPSDFLTLQFYFKRVQVQRELIAEGAVRTDTATARQKRSISLHRVTYKTFDEIRSGIRENWEFAEKALTSIARFASDSLQMQVTPKEAYSSSTELEESPVIFIFTGPGDPLFDEEDQKNLRNYIRRGGFIFIDNGVFTTKYEYTARMEGLLRDLGTAVDAKMKIGPIPSDHAIYRAWEKMLELPPGQDDLEELPRRQRELTGLFWNDRVVGIVSSKGYSSIWSKGDIKKYESQYVLVCNIIEYALKQR